MKFLALALLVAVSSLATPAAAFDGKTCVPDDPPVSARACLEDRRVGTGPDCTSDGGYSADTSTSGQVADHLAAWFVGGRHTCWRFGQDHGYVDGYYVSVGVLGTTWGGGWREYSTTQNNQTTAECDVFVEAASQVHELGCPAGSPPNPGWGDVIP